MEFTPPSFVFEAHSKSPVFFQSSFRNYCFCPTCLRHHETRFCSGKTEISYEFCDLHKQSDQRFFTMDDVNHYREELRTGKLENESNYKRPVAQFTDHPSNETDDSKSQLQDASEGHVATTSPSKAITFRNGVSSKALNDLKTPRYQASRYPTKPALKPKVMTALQKHLSWPFPAPVITYAHDSDFGCILSSSPKALVLPRSLIAKNDQEKLKRMRELAEKYDDCWGNIAEYKIEHGRLLAEVKMGLVAKGVFVKRCNGQYVNGLGDVAEVGEVGEEWKRFKEDARMTSAMLRAAERGGNDKNSECLGFYTETETGEIAITAAVFAREEASESVEDTGSNEELGTHHVDSDIAMETFLPTANAKKVAMRGTAKAKSNEEEKSSVEDDEPLQLSVLLSLKQSIFTTSNSRDRNQALIQRCWSHGNMLSLNSTFHTDPATWYAKRRADKEWESKQWVVFA